MLTNKTVQEHLSNGGGRPGSVEKELRRDLVGTSNEVHRLSSNVADAKKRLRHILEHWDERSVSGLQGAIREVIEEIL